jgi:hypothetical protein
MTVIEAEDLTVHALEGLLDREDLPRIDDISPPSVRLDDVRGAPDFRDPTRLVGGPEEEAAALFRIRFLSVGLDLPDLGSREDDAHRASSQ